MFFNPCQFFNLSDHTYQNDLFLTDLSSVHHVKRHSVASDGYFYRLARRIADMEGKGLCAADPMIKVGLPDGSRFAATIPPLSREGTAINIR